MLMGSLELIGLSFELFKSLGIILLINKIMDVGIAGVITLFFLNYI